MPRTVPDAGTYHKLFKKFVINRKILLLLPYHIKYATRKNKYKQMKRIAISLLLSAVLFPLSLSAQQSKTDESIEFRPHWYGQVQGGIAYTLGETAFKDLLSPAGAVSVGYQFHPAFGIRFGIGGWQGKGNVTNPFETYTFNLVGGNLDLTVDVASLFGGYNHKRTLRPYLLAGGAVIGGFHNNANKVCGVVPSEFFSYLWDGSVVYGAARAGFGTDIRLADNLFLNLEAVANVTSDHLNSKKADNPDFHFTGLAGLKFAFGGKPYRTSSAWLASQEAAKEAAEAARIAQEEAARRARMEAEARERAAREEAERLAAERRAAEEAARAAAAEHAAIAAAHGFNTFFALDSSVISKQEKARLLETAEWLKANPEFNVIIVGYADRMTGRPKHNLGLSERRVNAVLKVLVDAGVPAARIATDFKGDTVQPFAENVKNRVVIGTLE